MMCIILSEDDHFARAVVHRARLSGHSAVRYRDPVKLVDNLAELSGDVIVVRERDFPLHWQAVEAAGRFLRGAGKPVLILACPSDAVPAGFPDRDSFRAIPDGFSADADTAARKAAAEALAGILAPAGKSAFQGRGPSGPHCGASGAHGASGLGTRAARAAGGKPEA